MNILNRLHNPDLGILFVRIALGIIFIYAGWMKISNMDQVLSGFASIGIPTALTYLVAYSEFIGGILMILGLFARYAGVVLAVIMLVAIWKVHLVNGFSLAVNGYEYVLVLLLLSLSMVTFGAGKYSAAHLFRK